MRQTDRLLLRDWNPDTDAEAAFAIYGDPEVMRYVGDGSYAESVESMRDRLRKRAAQINELNDRSVFWAIVERQTELPVGTVIVKRLPDATGQPTADWEVGWHLRKSAWGNGYATEAGKTAIAYGFEILKLPVIYAVAYPENLASIRVMQRLGMTPLGRTDRYYGIEGVLFERQND
ncbi:GNAT family N-acetyltransferase [Phormidium tenue FACHB-886]|nr:GNAT family N-acetyltransferase [Phormidium tenue FACHB-886]